MRNSRFGFQQDKMEILKIIKNGIGYLIDQPVIHENILNIYFLNLRSVAIKWDGTDLRLRTYNTRIRDINMEGTAEMGMYDKIMKAITDYIMQDNSFPVLEILIIKKIRPLILDNTSIVDEWEVETELFYGVDYEKKEEVMNSIKYFNEAATLRGIPLGTYVSNVIQQKRINSQIFSRDATQNDVFDTDNFCCICCDDIRGNRCKINNDKCIHAMHCSCLRTYIKTLKNKNQTPHCPMCRAVSTAGGFDVYDMVEKVNNQFGKSNRLAKMMKYINTLIR